MLSGLVRRTLSEAAYAGFLNWIALIKYKMGYLFSIAGHVAPLNRRTTKKVSQNVPDRQRKTRKTYNSQKDLLKRESDKVRDFFRGVQISLLYVFVESRAILESSRIATDKPRKFQKYIREIQTRPRRRSRAGSEQIKIGADIFNKSSEKSR
jgi:hypothetical protein